MRKGKKRKSMAAVVQERKERLARNRRDNKRMDFLAKWLKNGRWRQVIYADKPNRYSLRDDSDRTFVDSTDLRAAIDILMHKQGLRSR